MSKPLIFLSIPGLREKDISAMPKLRRLMAGGEMAPLTPSFPCVTCSVQANMMTGRLPHDHGIIANGLYWRDRHQVEMWTSPNDCIEKPQLWDFLSHHENGLTSAVWFPQHSKGCEADYICTPAPIHSPDGSESLWCYTRPLDFYGELRDKLGHFPLHNYWGPLANIMSSQWITDSAVIAAQQWQPDFFYIYLPHLDYASQRSGPDSVAADTAVDELDHLIGRFADEMTEAYQQPLLWLMAGEYAINKVDHVTYPNRILREAGYLSIREEADGEPLDGEHLDMENSRAFAMVDHQISHIYVNPADPKTIDDIATLFRDHPGIAEVLVGAQRTRYALDHERSGEIILVSKPNSWQAYYWWLSDDRAPGFARKVDIHQKPGYDPVELFFDPTTKTIPLKPELVQGSHGAPPALESEQQTVVLTSEPGILPPDSSIPLHDIDLFLLILNHFGITMH